MPGYRALSSKTAGGAASVTRMAEAVQRHGDLPSATRLLEAALAASAEMSPALPGPLRRRGAPSGALPRVAVDRGIAHPLRRPPVEGAGHRAQEAPHRLHG